jgi:hypothetical protein
MKTFVSHIAEEAKAASALKHLLPQQEAGLAVWTSTAMTLDRANRAHSLDVMYAGGRIDSACRVRGGRAAWSQRSRALTEIRSGLTNPTARRAQCDEEMIARGRRALVPLLSVATRATTIPHIAQKTSG